MADVTVRTPQGELFTGPQERVAELQKTIPGAQVLTPEEATAAARQQTLREEQGGLVGAGVQFAESLIEGGTSVPIGQALERAYGRLTGGERGEQEALERMRVREQEQQAAALAGQAIGFGAAALVPVAGEAVAAGRAARLAEGATTLTRGIMGAGTRAAALAESKVAQEGVKRAVVGAAARGATEGAALGLGQVAKEAVLGEDISAELVAERVLTGALIGGAGGALFEGLGTAAVKAAEATGAGTVAGLAGAGFGFAAGGVPGAAAGGYIGARIGRAIGKSAAAGERAALTEAAEREAFNRKAAAGELRKTGDLTADEVASVLERQEVDFAEEATFRAEEAGTLDGAEAELVRQRRAELNRLRRETFEFADAQADLVKREGERFKSKEPELAAFARRQLSEAKDKIESIARSFGDFREGHLAKATRGFEDASEAVTGARKPQNFTRIASEMEPAEVASYVRRSRDALPVRLEETANIIEEQISGIPGVKKQFTAQAKRMREAAAKIRETAGDDARTLAEIHQIAEIPKRDFDQLVASGPSRSALADERGVYNFFQKSDGPSALRRALSDPQLFGEKIAATQATINQAWTRLIPHQSEIQNILLRTGMEKVELNPYQLAKVVDPAKAIPFIRGIGAPEQEFKAQVMSDWISSQLEFQQTALRLFKPSARQVKRIEESIGALQIMQRDLAEARRASASLDAAKLIAEDAQNAMQRAAAENLGGVGRVLTTMLDLERRAVMERMLSGLVGDADRRISEAAVKFVRGGERPGKFVAEAAKATGRAAAAADKPAPQTKARQAVATELATAAPKETRAQRAETALRQIATVAAVAGTPQAIEAFAYQGSAPVQSTTNTRPSENVALALARAAAFLNAKAPPVFQSNTLQPQLVQRQLSDAEIARWNAYVTTAAKPLSVLKDLEAGTVRREQVETLRALYPAIYSSIQAKVLEALHTSRSEVSYSQRVLLGVLFGAPTDPTLQPASIRALQSSFTPAQPAPSGAPRATPGRVRGSFAADLRTGPETLAAQSKVQ